MQRYLNKIKRFNSSLNKRIKYFITDNQDKLDPYIKNISKLNTNSLSFSGGGYNCVYHIGVVKYIFENNYLFKNTIFLGASGGAGIASFVSAFLNHDNRFEILDDIVNKIKNIKKDNFSFSNQVNKYISILTDKITKEIFNDTIKNKEKLYISVTNISMVKNELKNKFDDYDNFIMTLKASACIPFVLDDQIRKIDNHYYLDGGISNNNPIIDFDTITISCLYYPFIDVDLFPKKHFKLRYSFYPPNDKYIDDMIDLGYEDITKYLHNYKNFENENKLDIEFEISLMKILKNN